MADATAEAKQCPAAARALRCYPAGTSPLKLASPLPGRGGGCRWIVAPRWLALLGVGMAAGTRADFIPRG